MRNCQRIPTCKIGKGLEPSHMPLEQGGFSVRTTVLHISPLAQCPCWTQDYREWSGLQIEDAQKTTEATEDVACFLIEK